MLRKHDKSFPAVLAVYVSIVRSFFKTKYHYQSKLHNIMITGAQICAPRPAPPGKILAPRPAPPCAPCLARVRTRRSGCPGRPFGASPFLSGPQSPHLTPGLAAGILGTHQPCRILNFIYSLSGRPGRRSDGRAAALIRSPGRARSPLHSPLRLLRARENPATAVRIPYRCRLLRAPGPGRRRAPRRVPCADKRCRAPPHPTADRAQVQDHVNMFSSSS
jgi:hypothetical protein